MEVATLCRSAQSVARHRLKRLTGLSLVVARRLLRKLEAFVWDASLCQRRDHSTRLNTRHNFDGCELLESVTMNVELLVLVGFGLVTLVLVVRNARQR